MQKLLIFLLCAMYFVLCTSFVQAETMESNSFRIRMGNFNITSGLKSSTSYSLTDTVGQTAAGLFTSSGYAVLAGFQYMYTLFNFSFVVSNPLISLGTLIPNTFATGSNTLTVSAPGQGYSVTAYEINRLTSGSNYIDDTTCDSGPCTETTAQVWTNTNSLGFGYNMTGNDIPATFTNNTYFRPFPDLSLGDSPATVMSTSTAGQNRIATVTYKANIGGAQAAGNYATQIIYIATPVY